MAPSNALFGSSVGSDRRQEREGAVLELHAHAAEGVDRLGDLEQLQDHRLVGSEHLPAGDAEEQGVADLAGRTGDGDAYGFLGLRHGRVTLPTRELAASYSRIARATAAQFGIA